MGAGEGAARAAGGGRRLSRRGLLKVGAWGVAGGSLLLGFGGSAMLALRGCAPEVDGLLILNRHHYRTLSHLARVHLPRGGPFPVGADDLDLARAFDRFLADEPMENRRDLREALNVLEFGPVVFDLSLTTFSNLTPDEQLAHWRRWRTSDDLLRRKVASALQRFLSVVFYDSPQVWPFIHYPGPGA
jgi:hypothetical protein